MISVAEAGPSPFSRLGLLRTLSKAADDGGIVVQPFPELLYSHSAPFPSKSTNMDLAVIHFRFRPIWIRFFSGPTRLTKNVERQMATAYT